jgi:hypothetical protein
MLRIGPTLPGGPLRGRLLSRATTEDPNPRVTYKSNSTLTRNIQKKQFTNREYAETHLKYRANINAPAETEVKIYESGSFYLNSNSL